MKKHLVALVLVAFAVSGGAVFGQGKHKMGGKGKMAKATMAGGVIKKGAPLGESPMDNLAEVLQDPSQFAGKAVRIEGVIERSCTEMGCWMEIAAVKGGDTVRADTKHKFFIPLQAAGLKIKAEGTFSLNVLSKEKADHLAGEGAKIKRNADGTANEIAFVATGVELSK